MKITFDISSLVPKYLMADRNGRALARAIERAFQYVAEKAEDGLDILMDIDKMPEWRLDEVATETGILYDYTAQIEQKRAWIRNATPMNQILGTKDAVRQYLEGYFGEVEIQECWEYAGEPYHFRVTVGGSWTPDTEAWARSAIDRARSLRSVLDGLNLGSTARIALTATGDIVQRYTYPHADEIAAGEYPTENWLYIIAQANAAARTGTAHLPVAWDFAGEKPETNHLFIPDETPIEAKAAEEASTSDIYYPLCGDPVCGQ